MQLKRKNWKLNGESGQRIVSWHISLVIGILSALVLIPSCFGQSVYSSNILSIGSNLVAYWRLNETTNPNPGPVTAYDYTGRFNGTYGTACLDNVAGPRPPAFPGFENTNTALQNGPMNSCVTVPALNINTNTMTIIAWIYPLETQGPFVGIFFCNSTETDAGLAYSSAGSLGFTWGGNNNTWDTGILPPLNQWSMAALTVTPTNSTVYCINSSGLQNATLAGLSNAVQPFEGASLIGGDSSNAPNLYFNGKIDEVSVFKTALSEGQILTLYGVATGNSTTAWVPCIRNFGGVVQSLTNNFLFADTISCNRQAILWDSLAPVSNVWESDVLSAWGEEVLDFQVQNAQFLPILCYTAPWAADMTARSWTNGSTVWQVVPDSGDTNMQLYTYTNGVLQSRSVISNFEYFPPANVSTWTNYVSQVVSFLRAPPYNVQYFQIWNEAYYPTVSGGFWYGSMNDYMQLIHLPAAQVIHALGGKVVYGGWPDTGTPDELLGLLDTNNAWSSIDVLDMHYFSPADVQTLRSGANSRGYTNMPIWETEVGATTNYVYIADDYPRRLYWNLTQNWTQDMYRVYYFADSAPDDPNAEYYNECLFSGDDLAPQGQVYTNLAYVLGGKSQLGQYPGVTSSPPLTSQTNETLSSMEAFAYSTNIAIVIHLTTVDASNNPTVTVYLPVALASITSASRVDLSANQSNLMSNLTANSLGTKVTVSSSDAPGSLAQTWNAGSSMSVFYLLITTNALFNALPPPVFTPSAGGYVGGQTVTISCLTAGATIYYTTNGVAPNSGSPSGITPVSVTLPNNTTMTIQAYAVTNGSNFSTTVSATYITAAETDAAWTNLAGGSWSSSPNWTNNLIPNTSGVTADFSTLKLATNMDVTLDGPWTIGNMIFGDQGSNYTWEINTGSGGSLTLAASATPMITVLNQITTIATSLAGSQGLIFAGSGTLTINGSCSAYSGQTTISGGELMLALGVGQSFTNSISVPSNAILGLDNETYTTPDGMVIGYNNSKAAITGTGTIVKTGVGWIEFDYNVITNFSGQIDIQAGTLGCSFGRTTWGASKTGMGVNVAAGGWLDLRGNGVAVGALTGSGAVENSYNDFSVGNGVLTVGLANTSSTFAGVIHGNGTGSFANYSPESGITSLVKTGTGSFSLTGASTYTGTTTVSNGALVVNGSLAPGGAVNVLSNATFSGTGEIGCPVTIQAGGALRVGSNTVPGILSIDNTLTLSARSSNFMRICMNGGVAANDSIVGISTLNCGGTLVVTNVTSDGTALAAGDSFQLFRATNYSGNFADMTLPALGYLGWSWTNGMLSVVPLPLPRVISFGPLQNGSFPLIFDGASNHTYKVLMTTNLALPLTKWTVLTNGSFGAGVVNYTTSATNAVQFYQIESQ